MNEQPQAFTISLLTGEDGLARCSWCGSDPLYMAYHDNEWGIPKYDTKSLFEKICLEGFQAGLSWITILRKRENFREAFAGFDHEKMSKFTEKDVESLVQDAGIIRHRGKIEAVIHNARLLCNFKGDFAEFLWNHAPKKHIPLDPKNIPAQTPESVALSKNLRKLGFKFVGPTTMYAFMQSIGMVNDHLPDCHCYKKVEKACGR